MIEDIITKAGTKMKAGAGMVHDKSGLLDFVTDKDVQIQDFLISEILKVYPNAHFFSGKKTDIKEYILSGHTFFIDPNDDTTNYTFGYQHRCIIVGETIDGKLIAGWVYYPFKDQMWSARRGEGAWLNGDKIIVKDKELKDGIVAIGRARYNEGDKDVLFSKVQECYQHSLSVRNSKSAAIDLARVASGENVAYIERYLQPYDYAAASVIIEEAGGVIEQVDGLPITMDKGCPVLAGTPKAVEEARKVCEQYL